MTDIKPDNIRIEPSTVVKPSRGQYLPPKSSHNDSESHVIGISQFDEVSDEIASLMEAVEKFKNLQSGNSAGLSMGEAKEITTTLDKTKDRLKTEPEYGNLFSKITRTHEETHRLNEIRFGINAARGKLANKEALPVVTVRLYELLMIYDEASAILSGIKNTKDVGNVTKEDMFFLISSITIANEIEDEENTGLFTFKGHMQRIYNRLRKGDFTNKTHEIAYLVILSGDPDLAMKCAFEEITFDDFYRTSLLAAKNLLKPGYVIQNTVNNDKFILDVDKNLMQVSAEFNKSLNEK